jgi:RES domain-containing protein
MPPLTLCDYDVDCNPIADLSTKAARDELSVSLDDLACAWMMLMEDGDRVPSWEIAEQLQKEGFVGILVPSFFPGADERHVNLVLFEWGDDLPSLVRVYDPDDRLRRGGRSRR